MRSSATSGRKEGNVLFNDALNTFYLRLYGVRHMVKDHIQIARKETCFHHIGYPFRLTARVLLYAPSHRQDNTYHSLCYTSRGALASINEVVNKIIYKIISNKYIICESGCSHLIGNSHISRYAAFCGIH